MNKFIKKDLESLVVYVTNNRELAKIKLQNEEKVYLEFIKLSLALLKVFKKDPMDYFENILDILDKEKIDKSEQANLLNSFFTLLMQWSKKHTEIDESRMENIVKNFIELVESETESNFSEGDITVYVPELEHKNIDRNHFLTAEKIDARQFMQDSFIDDDLKADILESIQHFEEINNFSLGISHDYVESVTKILNNFIAIFNYGNEFKLLSESLTNFMEKISAYDIDSLSEEQKILLKEFISNTVDDLIEWSKKVIFEQSAIDIHYLDASINANISQFDIILSN